MRTTLVTVTVLASSLLGWSSTAMGQPCGAAQNCNPNISFPYRLCNPSTGKAEVRCSNTPNNVPDWIPYKVPLPACMKRTASDADPTSSLMEDVNGVRLDVNLPSDWEDIINDAVYVWNCLCGYTSSNSTLNSCCIPVQWSDNPNDFAGDPIGTLGIMYSSNVDVSICRTPCENGVLSFNAQGRPRIYLNNTTEFTKFVPSSGPSLVQRSLYSGTIQPKGPGGAALKPGFVVYSLRDVCTHEFGHWLGMRHPDETPDCAQGVTKTGIMLAKTPANREPRVLTEQDKCQFMKLYCPLLTSVQWEEVANPKPSDPGILLRLTGQWALIEGVDCDISSVVIYDMEGRAISNPQTQSDAAAKRLSIDFAAIASGPIVVVFQCAGSLNAVRRTFLIIRDN